MLAGFDALLKMLRSKARRGREQNDIDIRCQNLIDGVEADELICLIDDHLVRVLVAKLLERLFDVICKHVTHGAQNYIGVRGERLTGRTRSSATAADKCHFQGLVFRGTAHVRKARHEGGAGNRGS